MSRCLSCNKFAALETQEPEESQLDVEGEAENLNTETGVASTSFRITGDIRVVRNSECCGDEMKEANFEVDVEGEIEHKEGCDPFEYELEVEMENGEATETGGARYAKNMVGFACDFEVKCSCGASETVHHEDSQAASYYDELN